MTARPTDIDPALLGERLERLEGLAWIREAAQETPAYVVGGAVRDLLLGRSRADLDVVIEGDVARLAAELGGDDAVVHERFGTATVRVDGLEVDLARARAESYPHPGALPQVRPASLTEDLARRDFTINAMAWSLGGDGELVDPHKGLDDLRNGVVRVLHPRSFEDDPTRALRAARYAARLGFTLEPETESLLREADLGTVSADRVEAELRRVAREAAAGRGLALAARWGLLDLGGDRLELIAAVERLARASPWSELANREDAILVAACGPLERARELADAAPSAPSEAVGLAHGHDATTLLLARALGGEWLDRYAGEWRAVRLEIGGADLLEAGVEEGPAVGRGLEAALAAKLDGRVIAREDELRIALDAAREGR